MSQRHPDLFAPPDAVQSVSELVGALRTVVEDGFEDVRVEGELSNFRTYRSGHCYFTLKDENAQLRGVLFQGYAKYLFFTPQDGMLVRVHGSISLYEKRGDVQIIARSMRPAGEGALLKAFEELKARLSEEGLFDPQRKRPLPPFPETLGIITSGDGAALHDILSVLSRRFPQVRVLVCPVRVQGAGAAEEIAQALEAFGSLDVGDALRPDVLIVGRGGGSVEDLWAFNEEVVARALADCPIPTISAVGHETDVAITDYVADVRAATPSMAAEVAVPDRRDVEALVRGYHAALNDDLMQRIQTSRQHIRALTGSRRFSRPIDRLQRTAQHLDELTERLHRAARVQLRTAKNRVEALHARLALLDPARPLAIGYVRVERDGHLVRRAADLQTGETVTLRYQDGVRTVRVEK